MEYNIIFGLLFCYFYFTGIELGDPLIEGQQQQQQVGEQPVQQQFDAIQFGPEDLLLMANQNGSGPTSPNVCVDNFPGAYNFSVNFTTLQKSKNKHWDVSTDVEKSIRLDC